jgi:branched-chain amino acid transport system permease protein
VSATDQLLFLVISGAAIGSVYGLLGICYHLMFSVSGAVSFAQGDLVMLAGFLFIALVQWISSPFLALVFVVLIISFASGLVERVCIRPAIKGGSHNLGWILATVGLAIFLSNTSTIIWGNIPLKAPELMESRSFNLGPAAVSSHEVLALTAGAAIVILLRLLLNFTIVGRSIRVTAADPMAAELCGINSDRISLIVFMLSGFIGAISMVLIAPLTFISPGIGFVIGLKGFAAATVGGLDRAEGAFLGGILLGIIESLAAFFLWSALKDASAFLALAIIILIRPIGLFGSIKRA